MKTTVQQIILFTQAADKLRLFVNQQVEAVPVPDRRGTVWNELMAVEQATGIVKFMADQLCNAEVSVKG